MTLYKMKKCQRTKRVRTVESIKGREKEGYKKGSSITTVIIFQIWY